MSNTIRGEKAPGYDYWSRRCFGCTVMSPGAVAKNITKRRERRRNKKMCYDATYDNEKYEKRFNGE